MVGDLRIGDRDHALVLQSLHQRGNLSLRQPLLEDGMDCAGQGL
jgi:hypothetical protein